MSNTFPSEADVFIDSNRAYISLVEYGRNFQCTKSDPEIFFPERENKKQSAEAVKICDSCPLQIRLGCLALALRDKAPFGIWGGLRTSQRYKMLSEPATDFEVA